MMTNTEISNLANSIFIPIKPAKAKNISVTIRENILAATKLGNSCFSVFKSKDFELKTNSLFVMYAVATANNQAMVFAIISFIDNP